MGKEQISILIADDHPIVVEGLVRIIAHDDIFVVATAFDGKDALAKAELHRPKIAILDAVMPGMNGLEVAKRIRGKKLDTKIILLTATHIDSWLDEAIEMNLEGYLLKENTHEELKNALFHVARGNIYVSPLLGGKLLGYYGGGAKQKKVDKLLAELTPTELRVLALVGENRTSREISKALKISLKTVQNHRSNICQKLGLTGSNSLLFFAVENRLALKQKTLTIN